MIKATLVRADGLKVHMSFKDSNEFIQFVAKAPAGFSDVLVTESVTLPISSPLTNRQYQKSAVRASKTRYARTFAFTTPWSEKDIMTIANTVLENRHMNRGVSKLVARKIRQEGDCKNRTAYTIGTMTSEIRSHLLLGGSKSLSNRTKEVLAKNGLFASKARTFLPATSKVGGLKMTEA